MVSEIFFHRYGKSDKRHIQGFSGVRDGWCMSTATVSAPAGVHAHRCEACAKLGKTVVWIHPDTGVGDVAAHQCPQCGAVEWKKFLVEPGVLPRNQGRNAEISLETLVGYIILSVGIALVCYGAFLYIRKLNEKKEIPVA